MKQSPLANLSSTNINKNALIIDGELSELLCSKICSELDHSPHITHIYFTDTISSHSLELILSKVALINTISDICFGQGYTDKTLGLAMKALDSSLSKKTIWTNTSDVGYQELSARSKNSLVSIVNEIRAELHEEGTYCPSY